MKARHLIGHAQRIDAQEPIGQGETALQKAGQRARLIQQVLNHETK